jgi:carbamoyltransferase
MIILGISNNDYAGACLIINGKIFAAASEERFTRVKAHKVFPAKAIEYVLSQAELELKDVDKFAYGWAAGFNKDKHLELYFDRIVEGCLQDPKSIPCLRKRLTDEINNDVEKRNEFDSYLASHHIQEKAYYIDHHEAHAHAAMLCSPFENGLTISCDGRGDFQSFTISQFDQGQFKVLQRETSFDSLGYFYGRITALLGFKPNRHEGKITGLAAHGNPTKLLHKMKQLIDTDDSGRIRAKFNCGYLPSYHDNYDLLNSLFEGDSKEDIAAAAQQHLENILQDVLAKYINVNAPVNLCLAGGVFGNVKLNQRLREMPGVKNIFVLPSMGDDGLPLGAAVVALFELTGKRAQTDTMKLGPAINVDDELPPVLANPKYQALRGSQSEIVRTVLSALKNNQILGLVRGRMEFGPRALCSRSIICSAKDSSINQWLNQRMNRTEFMPFAPIIADVYASDSFVGWDDSHIASHFMTVTYNCTDYFAQSCPAVTHIDKTARPQVITQQSDPFMHQVLVGWEELSGEPALINTSFNMHEEPIILNVDNALRNLDRGVVDILVINEELLVWKTDSDHVKEFVYE